MAKYVYFFGSGKAEGRADMKNLLGGKGANLAEMTNINLPVPAGFTLTTEVCTSYYANDRKYPSELKSQVEESLRKTEESMGAKFGDPRNPLLVSCRSGARIRRAGIRPKQASTDTPTERRDAQIADVSGRSECIGSRPN